MSIPHTPCAARPSGVAIKWALPFAALGEALTGLALLIAPSLVGRLLLGEALTGIAVPVARVAGFALIAFSFGCWPGSPPLAMLIYSAAITLYLPYLRFAEGLAGVLLWPAVVTHFIVVILLLRARSGERMSGVGDMSARTDDLTFPGRRQ